MSLVSNLSHTRAEMADECLRKLYFHYVLRLRQSEREPKKDFGILVHVGLEAQYKGLDPDAAVIKEQLHLGEGQPVDVLASLEESARLVQALLAAHKKAETDTFEPLQAETEFKVPLGDGCLECKREINEEDCATCGAAKPYYTGRVDVVGIEHGHLKVVDHKTTGRFFKDPWKRSLQLIGNAYGVSKQLGLPVLLTAVKLFKREDPLKQCPECHNGKNKKLSCTACASEGRIPRLGDDASFATVGSVVTPEQTDIFLSDRRRIAKEIIIAESYDAWPMHPKSCDLYGRPCIYVDICWNKNVDWRDPEPWIRAQFKS